MIEPVDVDELWRRLGIWGKFQLRQLLVLLLAVMSCGFHMLSLVFIGYRPDYICKEVFANASNFSVSSSDVQIRHQYDKCSIKTTYNDSGVVTESETGCTNGWRYTESNKEFNTDRSFVSEWNLVCDQEELAELSQTLVMLGQVFGAFVSTSLADRFGRKPVHIICHVTFFFIVLATAFVPNFASFAVMRILTGGFQQGIGLTLAILNLEMFPLETRGYVEVLGLLTWTTGMGLVTPIAYIFRNMSWRYLQMCLACLSAWSLVEWWLIDESLRWLIANGKIQQAKEIIKRACKTNKKDYNAVITASGFKKFELQYDNEAKTELISKSGDNNVADTNETPGHQHQFTNDQFKTKSYTVMDLLKSKRLFITSLIIWFTWFTNNSTYYGIMLISSNLAGDRFLNFFLGSIVEYPAALMEYSLINRFGRRPAVILFHCICGVALVTATVLTTTANGNNAMIMGATVFTLIGKFAITGSYSTIFLYTPELYPTNMRNVGVGLASASSRAGSMIAPFSRNLAEIAVWAPGLIFGILCFIVSVLMLWVPETNKYELPQTLEECEEWYSDHKFQLPCQRKKQKAETDTLETKETDLITD